MTFSYLTVNLIIDSQLGEEEVMVAVQIRMDEDLDQEEAIKYRSGQKVELKQRPGVVHTIAEYDPMMVPPIWLENDPQPRYPEELRLVRHSPVSVGSVQLPGGCKVRYLDVQGRVRVISKTC
ncbi:hypothetical protein [Microcoleus sp. FACHB-68]|jgi:hypothetical protein|uniref:hypothetical protein n=1 Tax=Microcoleus sp. FACHB-68 TaxID=2692826 RepID=UPI00168768D6|nr:hypothetical protein [Microcoleus sp. FACHB-68]